MQKNVAGQKVGAQMVSATDGSNFTSAVTAYITLDAGAQAQGSVGSGACTHEGNGYHTYAPAQAETNGTLVAVTFIGTGAVSVTNQYYTTGYDPTSANLPVNIVQAAGTAWNSGGITANTIATGAIDADAIADNAIDAGAIAADAITSAKIADNAITANKIASDAITAAKIATGAIDADAIADNAIDAGAIASDAITSAKIANGAITAAKIATDAIDADALAADAIAEINATVDAALADYAGPTYTELLNLVRVMLRKDSALATDLAALITDINDDLGSGGGAFASTTDSQEAIRDKETDIETDTQDIQSRLPAALVSGRIDSNVGAMSNNVMTAAAAAADLTTELQSGLATAAALATVDTIVDALLVIAEKLDDTLEDDGGTYRFTQNALEEGPGGGSAPTAAEIADEVETRELMLTADYDAAKTAAQAGDAMTIEVGGIPTGAHEAGELNAIADGVLDRNMATGTDSGSNSTVTRTVRQALRRLRNKEAIVEGVGTVYKENDSTTSWTYAATTAAGDPLVEVNPT